MTEARQRKTDAEKLEALRKKEAALKTRIAAIENRGKAQDRKDDARFKIIVGGALLADAALHPETAQMMETILARAVTTDRDKDFIKTMLEKRKTKASS
jgi:muramidase (phage lysozyme)